MATEIKYDEFVEKQGEDILNTYTNEMTDAINANQAAQNKVLDQLGEMNDDGTWTEDSATDKLMDVQNESTDFAIQQIEEQKNRAEKDYAKEQGAAYADYQKQIDPYGVASEQMAANGLRNTGYAESSKVSMYNQYQTRITAARESYQNAIKDYDMAITQARLQNSSALAQIAVDALRQRMEYIIQFSTNNTSLLTSLASQRMAIKQQNLSNYMTVYNQLKGENYFKQEETEVEPPKTEQTGSTGSSNNGAFQGPSVTGFVMRKANETSFTSVSDVNKFFKEHGIDTKGVDLPLINENQWNRSKRKGDQDWAMQYNTYAEYLKEYVLAVIEATL